MFTLNEEELTDLLTELRVFKQSKCPNSDNSDEYSICPLCHKAKPKKSRCWCDEGIV